MEAHTQIRMKLVMITRKVDFRDALAGFAHGWVHTLAQQLDHLWVVTWQPSSSDGLPSNVTVISLTGSVFAKSTQLHRQLAKLMPQADGIFCHMNPEYTILPPSVAQWYKRKIVSWYTHKTVSWRRRLMELFADRIVTASGESFRKPWFPRKVIVIGHGIDTELFCPAARKENDEIFRVLTVCRLSPSKHYEQMIEAVARLADRSVRLDIVGDVGLSSQRAYADHLKKIVTESDARDHVWFHGWVPHTETVALYQQADLFLNLSETGSLDKAVLEAMACGCNVLTSNEAFRDILPSDMILKSNDPKECASAIRRIQGLSAEERTRRGQELRRIVIEDHGLARCMRRVVEQFC